MITLIASNEDLEHLDKSPRYLEHRYSGLSWRVPKNVSRPTPANFAATNTRDKFSYYADLNRVASRNQFGPESTVGAGSFSRVTMRPFSQISERANLCAFVHTDVEPEIFEAAVTHFCESLVHRGEKHPRRDQGEERIGRGQGVTEGGRRNGTREGQ